MKLSEITVPMLLWGLAVLLGFFMTWKCFWRWVLVVGVHLQKKMDEQYENNEVKQIATMLLWSFFFWFAFYATITGVSLHYLLRSLP